MSVPSLAPYFPFSRVRISGQSTGSGQGFARIFLEPDGRFVPICSRCGSKADRVHSSHRRDVWDLSLAGTRVQLEVPLRKVYCTSCGIRVEGLDFVRPWGRVTKRLAQYVKDLCKLMTVKEVADHLGLDWKTVKSIDKKALEEEFGETCYEGLRVLAIDEVSRRKGHEYLTVVLDYVTGRVVWVGKGRDEEAVARFFQGMTEEQREKIEAVALDMWDPYINMVREWCPRACIVFDLFHVVKDYNKMVDRLRNQEYRRASTKDRTVMKGTKYLLLRNKEHLKPEQRPKLKSLLELNETLSTVYILKDALKQIWRYRYPKCAQRALDEWCELAQESGIADLKRFARKLKRHSYGIINHCKYPIDTGKIEGVNNVINVMKRKAYGYRDDRYFILKIKQRFQGNITN